MTRDTLLLWRASLAWWLVHTFNDPVLFLLLGSNCSSSSEGENTPTALHAGICVRQQCVSIKDTIIAREALSLLVTCLQLRCQQLCKKITAHLACAQAH